MNGCVSDRISYNVIGISLGWLLFEGKVIKTLTSIYACGKKNRSLSNDFRQAGLVSLLLWSIHNGDSVKLVTLYL